MFSNFLVINYYSDQVDLDNTDTGQGDADLDRLRNDNSGDRQDYSITVPVHLYDHLVRRSYKRMVAKLVGHLSSAWQKND